eukprot:60334_1
MATHQMILLIYFTTFLDDVLSLDSLQWSDISSELHMPTAIALSAYATANDSLYIFGGTTTYSTSTMITDINVYRPKPTSPFFEWVTLAEEAPDALYCGSPCAVTITDSSALQYPDDSLIFIVAPYYKLATDEQYGGLFIFDTIASQWVHDDIGIQQMPYPVNRACVAYDYDRNQVYAIGGFVQGTSVYIADYVQIYSISNNTWTSSAQSYIAPYPIPIAYSACSYYDDFVYVFAGQTYQNQFFTVTDVYKYSIRDNQWSLINGGNAPSSAMMYPRVIMAPNSKMYLISGLNQYGYQAYTIFEDVYVFDPTTDTFSNEPSDVYDNHGVAGGYLTDLGGRITVFGGVDNNMNSLSTGRQTQVLPPSGNVPSHTPTSAPTSSSPSETPSNIPSHTPTFIPTFPPSKTPSDVTSVSPTTIPTFSPSYYSYSPTSHPVHSVTPFPSVLPTKNPLLAQPSLFAVIPSRHSPLTSNTIALKTSSSVTLEDKNTSKADYNQEWVIYGVIGCAVICFILIVMFYVIYSRSMNPSKPKAAENDHVQEPRCVDDKDVDESVKRFLINLGQAKYIETFAANEVYSMNVVKVLSGDDLKEMIDKIGPRRAIMNGIEQLGQAKDNTNIVLKRYVSHQSSARDEGEPKLLSPLSNFATHGMFVADLDDIIENEEDLVEQDQKNTAGVRDDEFVIESDSEKAA